MKRVRVLEMEKYDALVAHIKKYEKLCVAYSGGTDSTLLLKAAVDALGENAFAVIADMEVYGRREMALAKKTAEEIGATYYVADLDILTVPQLEHNESNRCYHCKKMIYSNISKVAYLHGTKVIADGRIVDDAQVYRPGTAAATEMGIVSPLSDCGITKEEARAISKELGLSTWNKPSNSCLATRYPYETTLTAEKLKRIEEAEDYLHDLGLVSVRIRAHGDIARIEVDKESLPQIFDYEEILPYLKDKGFSYVTVDLEGLRSGSMDIKRFG